MPRHIEVASLKNLRDVHTRDGVKFTKEQREENRVQIAEMRLRGKTFQDIGETLRVSASYAYQEYKVVEQRWRAQAFDSLAELKARELARIDLIENEAWRAYERSMEAAVEERRLVEPDGQGGATPINSAFKKTNRDGDAKWMRVILECVDKRIKLLGLDSPELRGGAHGHTASNDQSIADRVAKYSGVFGFAIVATEDGVADQPRLRESLDSERPPSEAGRVFDADGWVREAGP